MTASDGCLGFFSVMCCSAAVMAFTERASISCSYKSFRGPGASLKLETQLG